MLVLLPLPTALSKEEICVMEYDFSVAADGDCPVSGLFL
jgi:hypothetical protein